MRVLKGGLGDKSPPPSPQTPLPAPNKGEKASWNIWLAFSFLENNSIFIRNELQTGNLYDSPFGSQALLGNQNGCKAMFCDTKQSLVSVYKGKI
jgi:hypothetical protein